VVFLWLNLGRLSTAGRPLVRPGGGEQSGRVLRPRVPGRGRAGSVGRNLLDGIKFTNGSP